MSTPIVPFACLDCRRHTNRAPPTPLEYFQRILLLQLYWLYYDFLFVFVLLFLGVKQAALDEYQHALTAHRRALLNRTLNSTAMSHELVSLYVPLQLSRINTKQFPYLSIDVLNLYFF